MEEILFAILQFFGELLLQVVIELVSNIGWHGVSKLLQRKPHPVLLVAGYALFGALAGQVSLEIFPALLIGSQAVRIANLVLTPLLAACSMAAIGSWRRRRDLRLIGLDHFAYGYVFALAMALVRYNGAA